MFPSPGRVWKDRWVAFTNGDEFEYFKGSRDDVMSWVKEFELNNSL